MDKQIITALAHLECGDVEQAKRVLRSAIGLQPDRPVTPKTLETTGKLQAMAIACELGRKDWQYFSSEDRPLIVSALHEAAKDLDSKQLIDAVFKHCTVTLWPDFEYGRHSWYPFEHNLAQERDERSNIEGQLRLRVSMDADRALVAADDEVPSP